MGPILFSKESSTRKIFLTALLVGTLDALAAIIVYKADPIKLFQFIASGAVGNDAFGMGYSAFFIGLFFHYLIALTWTVLYMFLYPYLKRVLKHWIIMGVVWGIVVWLGMNMIVLPFLSRITPGDFDLPKAIIAALILICAVGLPLAYMTERIRK